MILARTLSMPGNTVVLPDAITGYRFSQPGNAAFLATIQQ